jgi:hypothetical protein
LVKFAFQSIKKQKIKSSALYHHPVPVIADGLVGTVTVIPTKVYVYPLPPMEQVKWSLRIPVAATPAILAEATIIAIV